MELPSESEEEELGQAEATNSRINSDGNRVRSVTYRPATRHFLAAGRCQMEPPSQAQL